ncbi:MAG: hypothetical protein U5K51_02825 [Flavobacteriaceae bacterium]|nr:hypothetical protein [Flavobacteriaceae bacterium]
MIKILFFLSFLPLVILSTCEDDDDNQIMCTEEARAGLNVTVSLGTMSSNTGEGVTVLATDGSYTETLTYYNAQDPIFSGAYERSGNYILTISKEGYQTYTSGVISVTRDECHVIQQKIHVVLLPL